MPTNEIKAFAIGDNPNVIDQATFEALPALTTGFNGGRANSNEFNKVFRQASTIAEAVAQYIVDNSGQDVLDNGQVATIVTNLVAAIAEQIEAYQFAPKNNPTLTGTVTVPNPPSGDNSQKAASTKFVKDALAPYAPLSGPVLSNPTANQPPHNDNSSKLATTSFVVDALTNGTATNTKFNSGSFSGFDAAGSGQVRMKWGNYGVILRNDGSSWYVLLTPSGQPDGGFNSLRPFLINLATGAVSIDASGAGTAFGGPVTLPAPSAGDSSTRAVNSAWVRSQGFLTGITRPQVTAALGFTPVRQDGGNVVHLGWNGAHIEATVDATDIGPLMTSSDFSSFNDAVGWQKLPSGLIIQWGFATVSNGTLVNFPIAFPNRVLSITTNDDGDLSQGIRRTAGIAISGNNAQFRGYGQDQSNNFAPTSLKYFAIGF
jgi:hypothetical protein